MPLLFAVDKKKKHNVLFVYDKKANKWCIEFEEASSQNDGRDKSKKNSIKRKR